jgi:hypothetical protein
VLERTSLSTGNPEVGRKHPTRMRRDSGATVLNPRPGHRPHHRSTRLRRDLGATTLNPGHSPHLSTPRCSGPLWIPWPFNASPSQGKSITMEIWKSGATTFDPGTRRHTRLRQARRSSTQSPPPRCRIPPMTRVLRCSGKGRRGYTRRDLARVYSNILLFQCI